jgi:hypothetical protein
MLVGFDSNNPCKQSIARVAAPQTLEVDLQAEQVKGPGGELRWRLSDVIGREEGLGVECLSGSGAIASAYNRAFAEVMGPKCPSLWGVLAASMLSVHDTSQAFGGWCIVLAAQWCHADTRAYVSPINSTLDIVPARHQTAQAGDW